MSATGASEAALHEALGVLSGHAPTRERRTLVPLLDAALTELAAARARLAEVAAFNPYPVEVWSELTTAEEQDIYDAIRGTSVRHPLDRLYASWGRRVLANRRAATAEEGRA